MSYVFFYSQTAMEMQNSRKDIKFPWFLVPDSVFPKNSLVALDLTVATASSTG